MNKKGFEFSFGWLFSIIVGIAFITAAIYAATTVIHIGKTSAAAESAKQFGILLNPLETGIEEGQKNAIYFKTNTRVYFDCDNIGVFGNQKISTSIESSIGEEWQRPNIYTPFNNKYIFATNVVEGKKITVFAKPLEMPYKVADIIYALGEKDSYCFVDSPNFVEEDMLGLDIKQVNISIDGKCPRNSTKVCFSSSGCDIEVNLNAGTVKKYRRTLYYADDPNNALIYGAIFADPAIYECQLKRLMKKDSALSEIYLSKTLALSSKGCNSNLEPELSIFSNQTYSLNSSMGIREINSMSDEIARRNNALNCRLF